MKLSIYSLKKIVYEGEADSVNMQTVGGEITVLNNHRPLLSMLTEGVLKITANGQEQFFQVKSGFVEVKEDNSVRLLVEEVTE